MQIAFLISQVNMNGPFFDVNEFILPKVFVEWKFVSGMHVFRDHNKMLGTIILGADLQHEVAGRGLSPNPPLALIFLQEKRFGSSLRRGR